jgi:seryl-tRNA synthetase
MLDISLLRKDLPQVLTKLNQRKQPQPYLDEAAFTALEAERKGIQVRTEELQAQRNSLSKQIGGLKGKGLHAEADAAMAQVSAAKAELEASATRLEAIQAELQALLLAVPNLPHDSVPVGADEHANVELRRWSPPQADGSGGLGGSPVPLGFEPKDHVDLALPLGLDPETGAKLAGSRFTVMKGPIARMHRALAQFMLDTQTERARLHRVLHALISSTATRCAARVSCPSSRATCLPPKKAGKRVKKCQITRRCTSYPPAK